MESFFRDGIDLSAISSQVVGGDGHFFDETESPVKIRSYLDSTKEPEKLKGMKWLLAMMSQGRDISDFFPDVVKNVVVKSVEVKKMVYIYLVHYADFDKRCREIALLSINSFQRDLAGGNQLIRGLALRVMSSIRVPDVIQIQVLAVRKCAVDSSPYVRKCAAIALPKIFSLDPSQLENLEEILSTLLQDNSTMVLGSSVASFNEICPMNFGIIHKHFRKLCLLLTDMDEWTQVSVLDLLAKYARSQFTDPSPGRAAAARREAKNRGTSASKGKLSSFTAVRRRVVKKAFYSDEEDESDEEVVMMPSAADPTRDAAPEMGSVFIGADADMEGDLDPDHRMLLKSSLPLLKSRNAAVVLSVCSLHHYCGSRSSHTTSQMGRALVRILKNHREIQYVVLTSINNMVQEQPLMFMPYLSDFFVKATDPVFNRLLKLDVLTALATRDNAEQILKELQSYIRHSSEAFVCGAVRAVGRVADAAPSYAGSCMEGLMHIVGCTRSTKVLTEAVVTLRQLLQQNRESKTSAVILHQLVKRLISDEQFKDAPVARASVVWLGGEFHEVLRKLAPDMLRILATGFAEESTETKTQIANFALKLSLRLPDDENVQSLMTYVLEMTRYDSDMDLRDRSRFMTAMMGLAPSSGNAEDDEVNEDALEEVSKHSEGILLAPKLPPLTLQGPVDIEGLPRFTLGSLSSVVGHHVQGYVPIPSWQDVQPDSSVREVQDSMHSSVTPGIYSDKPPISNDVSSSDSDDGGLNKLYPSQSKKTSAIESSSSGEEEDSDSDEEDTSDSDSDNSEEASSSEADISSDDSEDDVSPPPPKSHLGGPSQPSTSSSATARMGIRRVAGAGGLKKVAKQPQTASSSSSETSALPLLDVFSAGGASDSLLDFTNSKPTTPVAPSHDSAGTHGDAGGDLLGDLSFASSTSSSTQRVNSGNHDASMFFGNPSPQTSSNQPSSSTAFSQQSATSGSQSDLVDLMSSFTVSPQQPMNPHDTLLASFSPSSPQESRQSVAIPTLSPVMPPEEMLSSPHPLLKPELAGGLRVAMIFRHGARPTMQSGATCVLFEFENCSCDHTIRRVRIAFPGELKHSPLNDSFTLNSKQTIQLPAELVLAPHVGKSMKLNITCDRGHFTSDLLVEAWEVLIPLPMTKPDFLSYRSRLGGFSRNVSEINVGKHHCYEKEITEGSKIEELVRGKLNVAMIARGEVGGDADDAEWKFAGCSRKQMREEQVFVSLSLNRDGCMRIQVNAEDAVVSATLIDVLRKSVTADLS